MKTVSKIILSVVLVIVGSFVAIGVTAAIEFADLGEIEIISDKMYQECSEKYYDETKRGNQSKEYNDCKDKVDEFRSEAFQENS